VDRIDVERRDMAPSDFEAGRREEPVPQLGGMLTRGQCEIVAAALAGMLDLLDDDATPARPVPESREQLYSLTADFEGWARAA
jgi:hypothetical protein